MGDMSNGGAPRVKSIVEKLKTIVEELRTVSGSITDDGLVQTKATIYDSDGTEIGTSTNPIHVDIGGDVPDTMDISHIDGEDVDTGSGDADGGTLRVAVATDDVNLSAIKTAVEGTVKTSLQTAIPAGINDIGGVNVTKVAGMAPDVGTGNAGAGTIRVTVATDDANLAEMKGDVESILTQVDAKTSTLAKESGGNLDTIVTTLGGTIKTSLQSSIPAGTNEIGGVDVVKVGGTAPTLDKGDADGGTLRVAVATDDENLVAINSALDITQSTLLSGIRGASTKDLTTIEMAVGTLAKESGGNLEAIKTATEATRTATEAAIARDVLDQVTDTGDGPMQVVYAPAGAGAFRLEYVTIHLSAEPTTPGDIVVWLNPGEGNEYNVALFRVDPSEDGGVTDICYLPDRPIPCMDGDSVSVTYENDDGLTYGGRIVVRGA